MSPVKSADELKQRGADTLLGMEGADDDEKLTFPERCAAVVSGAIGSWRYFMVQAVVLALWIALNVVAWLRHWDPYPFILLNLMLSIQAACIGPIIMMSQNRQARITDRRNALDLQVSFLAEQENREMLRLLRMICERLDIDIPDDLTDIQALERFTEHKLAEHIVESADDGNRPPAS